MKRKSVLTLFSHLFVRHPDFVVGRGDDPYLLRWYLIPRNRWLNIYLHKFLRDDDDRALHDHPWSSISIVLKGAYLEHLPDGQTKGRVQGDIIRRQAKHAHRIELFKTTTKTLPAWTLFITGRKTREWGFICPQGWRHWKDFTNPADGGATIGRGCE